MRIGYYPGCSLLGSSREFDESVRAVSAELGLELVEVPDWNCCGASSAHVVDPQLALALPARILAQAEAAGLDEVMAPCAACFNRLVSAKTELAAHPDKLEAVREAIGLPYAGRVKVVNVLEVLARFKDRIPALVKAPFGHAVACYYGCLLVRPPRVVDFDRPEDPRSMDDLAALAGAKPIDWAFKTECCGAAFSVTRTDLVAGMCGRVLANATGRGAAALVVACPMCHSNLDMRRPETVAALGRDIDVPVLFVTQLLGLAMGLEPRRLGLHRHMVPVRLPEPAAAAH